MHPSPPRIPAASAAILVADDHRLVRDGLKLLVSQMLPGTRFVEAADGDALLHAAQAHPELRLALVDLRMPQMQGGLRLAELAFKVPALPLVIVSAFDHAELVREVSKIASVHAFVPKDANTEGLRFAIFAALRGQRLPGPQRAASPRLPPSALTPRQEQIRTLLRQGMSNKRIAGVLGITEGTVKNHITELFRVLNLTNRTQAAVIDIEMP